LLFNIQILSHKKTRFLAEAGFFDKKSN